MADRADRADPFADDVEAAAFEDEYAIPSGVDAAGGVAVDDGDGDDDDDGDGEEETEPVPSAFVKWAAIPPILEQANTAGIRCTFLMKRNGSLLSFAGDDQLERVMSGIVSNVWNSYRMDGHDAVKATQLKRMMIECEQGNVFVVGIGHFLLAVCAEKLVPRGLLRCKALAVANYLRKPLASVYQ